MVSSVNEGTLHQAVNNCSDLFGQYLGNLGPGSARHGFAEDLWGRFNLWVAYTGALAAPRASLDARIVGQANIKAMILELLSMIQANLEYELDTKPDNVALLAEAVQDMEESPSVDVGLEAIGEALKRLHSLGAVIQRTAAKNLQQRQLLALHAQQDESHCYKSFVRYKFPKAKPSLVDQIGNSLYVRGKSLFYRQQHNRQLAAKGLLRPVSAQTGENAARSSDSEESNASRGTTRSGKHSGSHTDRPKRHWEAVDGSSHKPGSNDSSDASDSSSNEDSVSEGSASDESFIYLKEPDTEEGQQSAPCPVCFESVGLFSLPKEAFRDHLARDVQPYVCISEECKQPPRFFAHLDDWESHMQTMHTPDWARRIHTLTWYCEIDTCNENAARSEFTRKEDFIQHFSTAHPKKFTKPQIMAKARRNRTTRERDMLVCPLCDCRPKGVELSSEDPQRQLAEHIAKELRRVAFASYTFIENEDVGSISLNTCVSGESGATNHRLSEVPSEGADLGTLNETKNSLDDISNPPELDEPVVWPTSLARVYPPRDVTLELFATALQRPQWEELYERYHGMMENVNAQEPDIRALAIRSLLWVTFAKRPMTGRELQHAIVVKPGDRGLDGTDLPRIDDIIEACGGFLAVDADAGTLRLADVWMSGWLKANWPDWLHDTPEGIITTVCLSYLLFDDFGAGFCTSDDEFEERLRSYPFYRYAAHNWVHQTRNDKRGNPLIWDFLQSEDKVSASYQALLARKGSDGYSQVPPPRVTGLHLAVHFGLEKTVKDLLRDTFDPDVTDSHGRTPLSWAAEGDKPGIVITLLEQGADVNNAENRGGFAPISWAAWKGLMEVMETLLQFGADTDVRDSNLYTPLLLATWNGHREIVELLVDKGAYVDAADVSGRTPLLLAAKNGYHLIAEHLLRYGANIEARDDDGNSSLSWAVKMGHRTVVKLLVEHGADVQAEDDRGQTPLACALENGRQDIVELLLETEVKVEPREEGHGDSRSRTGGSGMRGKGRRSQSSTDEDSAESSDEESEEEGDGTKPKRRDKGKAPSTEAPLKKAQAPRSLDYSNWRRLRPSE
ncbi:hypothetical protein V8C44DRAFT_318370 [Trichoderma aethiopicum]